MTSQARISATQPWVSIDAIRTALREDGKDLTTSVYPDRNVTLNLVARAPGRLCGLTIAADVFCVVAHQDDKILKLEKFVKDGQEVKRSQPVMQITGSAHVLLRAERTALNYLCHLSGIATLTQQYVRRVADLGTVIRDTRKTTPGLRQAEKWAVRCGGGQNHRMSLHDVVLVKDNHVAMCGGDMRAALRPHRAIPVKDTEVEVDSLEQLAIVLDEGWNKVLLDNMTLSQLRRAVALVKRSYASRQILLEASGGVNLQTVRKIAQTGVHRIAVGALTHSAPVLDFGADYVTHV